MTQRSVVRVDDVSATIFVPALFVASGGLGFFFAKTVKRMTCFEQDLNLSQLGLSKEDLQPRWDIESNSVSMLCYCVEDQPSKTS